MQTRQGETARFVVGLGNPGRRYARTRHNAGFRVLRELRRRWDLGRGRKKFGGRVHDARVPGPDGWTRRVVLLAPETFMNRSGQAAGDMAAFYRARCDEMLVVLDDLALPLGRLRARASGSAGGHKGLADVLRAMGGQDVPRLRIGIGAPPPEMAAEDYVLAKFSTDEEPVFEQAIVSAADAVEDWVFHDIEYIAQKYNRSGG